MPKYQSIAHIIWELPFPLRLPPVAFLCWEPGEGLCLFDPRPQVGELAWKRRSCLLQAAEVFPDVGHPNQCYPTRDYLITSKLHSGREIKTARLIGGPEGGFVESRPYTSANIFLCIRHREDYCDSSVLDRAGRALNNVLDIYRFISMDPLARSMRADQDSYYTLVSVANLPSDIGDVDPKMALQMIGSLSFGLELGVSCAHHIGLNSFDDLVAGETISCDYVGMFESLITKAHELELFHQLVFSAMRRLKRKEHALAVLDAQSAFESLVATLVVESLTTTGKSSIYIDHAMAPRGRFHSLQQRLEKLDHITAVRTGSGIQPAGFLGSLEEKRWRKELYNLRNRIVHEGLRDVSFAEAKKGLVAGLHAIHRIQNLIPAFNRKLIWSGFALNLDHLQESPGRLSRLFEI